MAFDSDDELFSFSDQEDSHQDHWCELCGEYREKDNFVLLKPEHSEEPQPYLTCNPCFKSLKEFDSKLVVHP